MDEWNGMRWMESNIHDNAYWTVTFFLCKSLVRLRNNPAVFFEFNLEINDFMFSIFKMWPTAISFFCLVSALPSSIKLVMKFFPFEDLKHD